MTWRSVPLRSVYRRVEESGRPELPLLSVYRDHGVVLREGRDDNNNKASDDLTNYKVVRPGDLVLNKMKTWQGSLAVSRHQGIVSPAYFVGRPVADADERFMHHLLRSLPLIAEYGARSKGIRPSQWDLAWDEFASIRVRLPTLGEQRTIADYLDTETSRIDALISRKKKEADLVSERREAMREQAFDVERGWPLRYLLARPMAYGVLVPRFVESDHGTPMLRISNLDERGRVVTDDVARIDNELSREFRRTIVREGDLVLSVVGSMGRAAVIDRRSAGSNLNRPLARLQLRKDLPARLLWHWVQTPLFMDQARMSTGSGAAQPTLNLGDLANFRVGLPRDPDRWPRLLQGLEVSCRVLDQAEDKVISQVRLLAEHRQALITAAVTGALEIPGVAA